MPELIIYFFYAVLFDFFILQSPHGVTDTSMEKEMGQELNMSLYNGTNFR